MKKIIFMIVLFWSCCSNAQRSDIEKLLNMEQYDQAETISQQWIQDKPKDANAWFWHGRVMAVQASSSFFSAFSYANESLEAFKKAVELEPSNPMMVMGLVGYYRNAPSIVGGGEAHARALIKQSYIGYPERYEFQLHYGLVLQQEKKWADAFQLFEKMMSAEQLPERLMGYYQFARTSIFSESRTADGANALKNYLHDIATLHKPNAALPSADWARYRLAQLYARQGAQQQFDALVKARDNHEEQALSEAWQSLLSQRQ